MKLSVVVPVRDEAPNIVPLVGEIWRALEGRIDYEIICVDDGSEDQLPEALRAARAAAGVRMRVLRHERSCGQSTAVSRPIPIAVISRGEGRRLERKAHYAYCGTTSALARGTSTRRIRIAAGLNFLSLIALPHVSCDDPRYIDRPLDFWFENLGRFFKGTPLKNRIDSRRDY